MSIARYRIGNNITVFWAIHNRDGSPFDMTGRDVRLYYTNERGRKEVDVTLITLEDGTINNVIRWDFKGEDQRTLGKYTLTAEITESMTHREITKDYCEAFILVSRSEQESEEGDANISTGGDLILASKLDIYRFEETNVDVAGIKESIASLNESLGGVTDSLGEVNQTLGGVSGEIANINASLSDISEESLNLKVTINGIQSTVNDIGTELTNKASVESVIELGENITEIQTNQYEQSVKLNSLGVELETKASAESVTQLGESLSITNEAVATQSTKVTDLEAEVGTKASAEMVTQLTEDLTITNEAVAEQTLKVTALESEIATKASAEMIAQITEELTITNNAVAEQTLKVTALESEITTKASAETVAQITEDLTIANNAIAEQTLKVTALESEITTKASAESVAQIAEDLTVTNNAVAEQTLKVTALESEIATKASAESVTQLTDDLKVTNNAVAEQTLKVTALESEISSKASTQSVIDLGDSLKATNESVAEQTIKVSELESSISNLATVESVTQLTDALGQRIDVTNESLAEQTIKVGELESEISNKASTESVTAIGESVKEVNSTLAEQKIRTDELEASIENLVTKETFDATTGEIDAQFTTVKQTTDAIEATIKEQNGEITSIKETVSGLSVIIGTFETDLNTLNERLDTVTESYFLEYTPSVDNEPASSWIEDGTEAEHQGDTFTNISTEGDDAGRSWRWLQNTDGEWEWQLITDADAQKALLAAANAQAAADGKVTIFYVKPTSYKVGDIWFVESDDYSPYKKGEILSATTESTIFSISHWESKTRYTEAITYLDYTMNTTFRDGVIDDAERKAIIRSLHILKNEKSAVDSRYGILIINANFTDAELKSDFSSVKSAYDTAYDALVDIAEQISSAETDALADLFDEYEGKSESYRLAYTEYNKKETEVNEALMDGLNPASQYIDNITNDGVLTPIEKEQLFEIYRGIAREYDANVGNAYNYKIWAYATDGTTEVSGTNGSNGRYDIYVTYRDSYGPIAEAFSSDIWGFGSMDETTTLPEGYSTTLLKNYLDAYYAALGELAEVFSAITAAIEDAQKAAEETLKDLTGILSPEEMSTQVGKGVVLSTMIATRDTEGDVTAGMNASSVHSSSQHGRVVFAGGVNDTTDWTDAEFIVYEDGYLKANKGEFGDGMQVGTAILNSVLSGEIDLLSYPVNGTLVPLFQVEKDSDGNIVGVTTPYNFGVNQDLIVMGDTSSGGSGDNTTAVGATSVSFNGVTYPATDGVVTIDGEYYTKSEVNAKIDAIDVSDQLTNYATKTYVSTAISDLVNGAPTTLDTLKEVADAIEANEDVVAALDSAIGTKANQSDLESAVGRIGTLESTLSTEQVYIDQLQAYFSNGVAKQAAKVTNALTITFNGTTYTFDGSAAKSIALSAANIVSALGTTAVNRATADASGNTIASYYTPLATYEEYVEATDTALGNRYTKTEISNLLNGYLPKAGGTIGGALTISGALEVGGSSTFADISATSGTFSGSVSASSGFKTGNSSYGPTSVELYGATPLIDFHYGSSSADYTNRIIEGLSGQLTVTGALRIGLAYATSTAYKFYVAGTTYLSNKLTIGSNGMSVTGAAYFGGGTSYYFGSTGNVSANTLTAAGAATLKSTLAVTGATTLTGALTANGGATITGDVTINGNLIVTGDTSTGGSGESGTTVGASGVIVGSTEYRDENGDGLIDLTELMALYTPLTTYNGLATRVTALEGGSATSITTTGSGNVITAISKSGTTITATKGITALTSHQSIYALSVVAGSTTVQTYTPNSAAKTLTFVAGSNVTLTADATNGKITIASSYTNTKNTAGSTDSSSKLFLIGATSQAANPQTYSHDTAYVGTDGCLYSGSSKVLTSHQSIYALTINNSAGTAQVTYTPNSAAKTLTLTKAMVGLGNVENTAFYARSTSVNGTSWAMAGTANASAFTIYAPTTAGTSGYLLQSSGSGAPAWVAQSSITALGTITTGTWNGSTIGVAYGGTGKTTLTSGYALIGNGTSAVALRAITNNTSATAVTASTNLITANTLFYHKGNSNITTVGTITSGTWNGTAIANAYLANSAITINGTSTSLGGSFSTASITAGTAGTSSATSGYTLAVPYVTMNKYGIVTGYGTHTHTINSIPNSSLANSSMTIAGTSVSLGGSITAATIGNALTSSAPAAYATTASKLATARTIWGQSFDGTGNVSGALTGVTDITMSGGLTLMAASGHNTDQWISFKYSTTDLDKYSWRLGYLGTGRGDANYLAFQSNGNGAWTNVLRLGLTSYLATFAGGISATTGSFSSTLGVTGATTLKSTLAVTGASTFTGNTTNKAIAYFANGTTYYVNASGAAKFASLTSAGAISGTTGSFSSSVTTSGAALVGGALTVGGGATITGDVTINGNLIVTGDTASGGTSSSTAGSTVTFTQNLTSGTKVGTITIDGTDTILYAPTDTNTTYSAATTSAAGLMSAADKTKLDAITASADSVSFTQNLTTGTAVGKITINGTDTILYAPTNTDTKITAGCTNTSSKIYLIGATSQGSYPQTYSHDTAFVGTDGHLYSNSVQVVNLSGTQALTNKTYNGYTLGAACAKAVTTSVTSGSTALVTSGAVYDAIQDVSSSSAGEDHLLSVINGTTMTMKNGSVIRIDAAATLNMLNITGPSDGTSCVIHLIKTTSCTLAVPVVASSGVRLHNASTGAFYTASLSVGTGMGLCLIWDSTNSIWVGTIE